MGLKKELQRDSHHVNKILIPTPGKMVDVAEIEQSHRIRESA
jgi:hypothetical protein